jgi:hypothetical protein
VKYFWKVKKEGLYNGRKKKGRPPPPFLTTSHRDMALRHFLQAETLSNSSDNRNKNNEMDQEQGFFGLLTTRIGGRDEE